MTDLVSKAISSQVSANVPVAPMVPPSERSAKVAAKKASLSKVRTRNGISIDFSALAADPIYQRVAEATCSEELKAELSAYGMDSPARLAAFPSVEAVRRARGIDTGEEGIEDVQALMARARQEALRSHRLMRHAMAVKDPLNQALRHTQSTMTPSVEQAFLAAGGQSFAKPSSLQSDQSPAAYLSHLYRIASGRDALLGIIEPSDGPHRLAGRRPDLAILELSETNLKQEIPTIELVNEVLEAGLGEIDLHKAFFPIALPFDEATETVHAALAQMDGTTLNKLQSSTAPSQFPLQDGYRLAHDLPGLLRLTGRTEAPSLGEFGSEIALISEGDQTDESLRAPTLGGLYDASDVASASDLSALLRSLDLDFDALAQLLGLYPVAQENGEPVPPQAFATAFVGNTVPFEIVPGAEDSAVTLAQAPLDAPTLRGLNYLARLHHATRLDFHHLNWLLQLPGTAITMTPDPDDNTLARRHVSAAGLRLMASFGLYHERFGLGVDAYAALFGEVNPNRRVDQVVPDEAAMAGLEQTETSFLRELFGQDAPTIHDLVAKADTSVWDADFAAMLRKGLRLTEAQLEAVTAALEDAHSLSSGVDVRGLGALYRISMLCRMLGWSVLSGLELIAALSAQSSETNRLWTALTARNETVQDTAALSEALDQLVGIAGWMQEANVSPDRLLSLLTPTQPHSADEADRKALEDLASAVAQHLVRENTFSAFETWGTEPSIYIGAQVWRDHLLSEGIIRTTGVFMADLDREAILTAARGLLNINDVDLDDETIVSQLNRLTTQLEELRDLQATALQARVASLADDLTAAGAGSLIKWAGMVTHDLLDALLAGAEDNNAVALLHVLRQYALAVETFSLGDIELWLIGEKPHWLTPTVARTASPPVALPLNLEQLFLFQTFSTLQVGTATDEVWRGYLTLANDGQPAAESSAEEKLLWFAASMEVLAIQLGAETDDVIAVTEALIGADAVPGNIATIDAVARHVRLASDLGIGGEELLALKSTGAEDTPKAAAAALAGLSRYQDGNQIPAFEHVFAESKRDALLAAYMQTRVALDPLLAQEVVDRETLYKHLLLDVNVTSAVPTSRMVEAISSLQLYINRALSGLEPGVTFKDRSALAAQWQIDRRYREWEANQKLLLHPQNYIEPELRYLTSPEFDELQQAVSGKDVSHDSVEAAVNGYMAGLANSCDLSVCSVFTEDPGGPAYQPQDTKHHFLARAKWEPGRFFYRKLEADYKTISELADSSQYLKALDWGFWQEVVIPNTHKVCSDVSVCVLRNRYYFFWLELEEQREQHPEKEVISWVLHPRYMRCDDNALTGPMQAPGMFVENSLPETSETVVVDGGFRWGGTQPQMRGHYHPIISFGAFAYGEPNFSTDKGVDAQDTIFVTFGVELKDGQSNVHQTSLQMRMTDTWSDAILFQDEALDPIVEDATPAGFACVHPRLVSEDHCHANSPVLSYVYIHPETLKAEYYLAGKGDGRSDFHLSVDWKGPQAARAYFHAAPKGSTSVGWITTELTPGDRIYERSSEIIAGGTANGAFTAVRELEPLVAKTRILLMDENTGATATSEWKKQVAPEYRDDFPDMSFLMTYPSGLQTTHVPAETFKNQIVIPEEWDIPEDGKLGVRVMVELVVEPKDMEVSYVVLDGPTQFAHMSAPENDPTHEQYIGVFRLGRGVGKQATAWALLGEHANQNFVHVTPTPYALNYSTYVLLNSTSALASLARSMPRPGGCTSLFVPENQMLPEQIGTFPETFRSETIRIMHPEDRYFIPDEHLPAPHFDFDASYGVYGWELFYHIPSAIAAGFSEGGRFDEALSWLGKIFDPSADAPWQLYPLAGAKPPENGLAFDTGNVIVDPDRIAQDYPFYYQQATIRQYLETLIAAGDAFYEKGTQEALQEAKHVYVSAKHLFTEELPELLETLTNQHWPNPSLEEAATDGFTSFLPPYNQEMFELYDAIDARLSNLRKWLDIEGEPLNVPLLAAPIDPRQLQRAAKTALSLRTAEYEQEEERESQLDFITVARTLKTYITNLKTTSSRLQAAREKGDGARMARLTRTINREKVLRAAALQELTIDVAEHELAAKEAKLGGANAILANHIANVMVDYGLAMVGHLASRTFLTLNITVGAVLRKSYRIIGSAKSVVPTIYGFATGGQQLTSTDLIAMLDGVGKTVDAMTLNDAKRESAKNNKELVDLTAKIISYSADVHTARAERDKAKASLDLERAQQLTLTEELYDADKIIQMGESSFSKPEFYDWLTADLEMLFVEEWSVTQEFCRLLVRIFDTETEQTNGASFLRTTSLGGEYERFNAPYRLALDIERMEAAYVRNVIEQESQSTSLEFRLSELPALGVETSAVQALVTRGEAYFELTEQMFDALYPGQYDRRIQGIHIRFPGLAEAGIRPHARLTQIANTRCLTPERDLARGAKLQRDRHALQSIMIGAPDVDTRVIELQDGHLKRFQNTGVASRWHLSIPSVLDQRQRSCSPSRENAGGRHSILLEQHLDDVVFDVTFSGRW